MKKSQSSSKEDQKKEQNNSEKNIVQDSPIKEEISIGNKKHIYKSDGAKVERAYSTFQQKKDYINSNENKSEPSKTSSRYTQNIEQKHDNKKDFRFEKATYHGHTIYKCSETNRVPKTKKDFTQKPIDIQKEDNKESIDGNKIEEIPLSAADIWKNAAKILDSKKVVKKPQTTTKEEMPEKKKEKKTYTQNEFVDALKHSILNRCTIKKTKISSNKVQVPDFFPKKPIHIFSGPDVYQMLDIDTLFFIFYFSRNERQVFSARELKKYSWRYHTKYNTWFQRLEEPKLITEYYEQGIFLFFDFEVTWTNRKKKDFTFEYKYLENIEM